MISILSIRPSAVFPVAHSKVDSFLVNVVLVEHPLKSVHSVQNHYTNEPKNLPGRGQSAELESQPGMQQLLFSDRRKYFRNSCGRSKCNLESIANATTQLIFIDKRHNSLKLKKFIKRKKVNFLNLCKYQKSFRVSTTAVSNCSSALFEI